VPGMPPRVDGTSRTVTVHFVRVQNLARDDDEQYECEVAVFPSGQKASLAGDHPAVVRVSNDSVVSLSVFLRKRGGPSAASVRGVGQVIIPIWAVPSYTGTGLVRTWLLLGRCEENLDAPRSVLAERFRMSVMDVPAALHAPRICISLMEGAADPSEVWPPRSAETKCMGYDMLLESHYQHSRMLRAYSVRLEAQSHSAGISSPSQSTSLSVGSAEDLLEERRVTLEELQKEANRRIEIGNETVKKVQVKLQLLVDEEPALLTRHAAATKRLATAKSKHDVALRDAAPADAGMTDEEVEAELGRLRTESEVLASQKDALMKLVADFYAQAHR